MTFNSGADTLRLVIVGLTGHGKSSIANNILAPHFLSPDVNQYGKCGKWGVINRPLKVSSFSDSVTSKCERIEGHVQGRTVALVDTPGFCDTSKSYEDTIHEIMRCMYLTVPGPHVILLVLRIGRFTKEVVNSVEMLKTVFGKESVNYAMVVFTGADELRLNNERAEDMVSKMKGPVRDLLRECKDRYVTFNNMIEEPLSPQSSKQIEELLVKAEEITQANGGQCYTNDIFANAGKIMKEKIKTKDEEIKREVREREELEQKLCDAEAKLKKEKTMKAAAEVEQMKLKDEVHKLKLDIKEKVKMIQKLKDAIRNPNQMADEAAAEEKQVQEGKLTLTLSGITPCPRLPLSPLHTNIVL